MRYSKILLAIVLISILVFGSTMSAFAVQETYTLTVLVNEGSTGMGTVTGTGVYPKNEQPLVKAIPNPNGGFQFVKWVVDCAREPIEILTDSFNNVHKHDVTVEAYFEEKSYDLTTGVNDESMGTVTGMGRYKYTANINIKAEPKPGYKFVKWEVCFGPGLIPLDKPPTFECNLAACGPYVPTVFLKAYFEKDNTVTATVKYLNASDQPIKDPTQQVMPLGDYTLTPPAIPGYTFGVSSLNASGTITAQSVNFEVVHKYYVPQVITNTNTVTETVFVNVPATTVPATTAPATTEVITTEAVPLGAPAIVNFDEFVEEETMPETEMMTDGEVVMEEEVPLADALPQTGQLSAEMFYGVGGLISGLGLWLKRRK